MRDSFMIYDETWILFFRFLEFIFCTVRLKINKPFGNVVFSAFDTVVWKYFQN